MKPLAWRQRPPPSSRGSPATHERAAAYPTVRCLTAETDSLTLPEKTRTQLTNLGFNAVVFNWVSHVRLHLTTQGDTALYTTTSYGREIAKDPPGRTR